MAYHLLLVTSDAALRRLFERSATAHPDLQFEFSESVRAFAGSLAMFDIVILDRAAEAVTVTPRRRAPRILMIAADSREAAEAFRQRADDCLIHPFAMEEATARLDALLRKAKHRTPEERVRVRLGRSWVNFRESELRRNGRRVELSDLECRLLRCFVEHRGHALSRATLLRLVWGVPHAPITRTVDVHVLRLRRKIEEDPSHPRHLLTVPGVGYRFEG